MSYVIITIGLMTYTFGWSAFMLPARIVGGGVSGLSAILYYAVGIHIPIGILNLIFNGILVAIGFKMLGSKFGANTIYGIAMSSVFFIMWQQGLHVENLFMNPDGTMQFDPFMCAIIGPELYHGRQHRRYRHHSPHHLQVSQYLARPCHHAYRHRHRGLLLLRLRQVG